MQPASTARCWCPTLPLISLSRPSSRQLLTPALKRGSTGRDATAPARVARVAGCHGTASVRRARRGLDRVAAREVRACERASEEQVMAIS